MTFSVFLLGLATGLTVQVIRVICTHCARERKLSTRLLAMAMRVERAESRMETLL